MLPPWWVAAAVALGTWLCAVASVRFEGRRACQAANVKTPEGIIRVTHLFSLFEFPTCYRLALEFGLFRTFGIPTISTLLHATGEFKNRAGKRYDDTDLLVRETMEHEMGAERPAAAIRRLNAVHGKYASKISNDDMLYTLSVFLLEPVRFVQRFEWREPCKEERDGLYAHWRWYGEALGIRDIPGSFEAFDEWNRAYEATAMVWHEDNVKVAEPTLDLLLGNFPALLRPAARACAESLMDERLLKAMRYPDRPVLRAAVYAALRARAAVVRWLCLPRFSSARRTEPGGDVPKGGCPLRPRFNVYADVYKEYHVEGLGTAAVKAGEMGARDPQKGHPFGAPVYGG